MRIYVSDPAAAKELTRFFRRRDYLAVVSGPGLVDVAPIQSVDARHDLARTRRDLDEWAAENPNVRAVLRDDD
jgi:hypothetical protein